MSAIKAEYVNFKNVMSRKSFQIILEVPAEQAQEVLSVLGMPSTHESKYVGVALLNPQETENAEDYTDAIKTSREDGERISIDELEGKI